ncbi:beta-xylosidase [Roseburia sp. CAG:309]|nr:beta-xylosidase [Roseburia sp. CAG:309]
MLQIKNPVLPGFNADPSIIRVDDTYYIANSTFEWFPGVRLHESMADEMTRFSKESILQQAATSMLAQANQANQGVLSLLQ